MIDRSALANSFEFVVVAGARARQLMRGATPRVQDGRKAITVAQREVAEGRVEKTAGDEQQQPAEDRPSGH
jgi:DNA-directed RNA polymerase subunit K/omega